MATKKQRIAREEGLADVVALVHSHLSLLLRPEDACGLLVICSGRLGQDVQDAMATKALLHFYEHERYHFGGKCIGDWHQLLPKQTKGGRGFCGECDKGGRIVPKDLKLPRILNARTHILEGFCRLQQGIGEYFFKTFQVFYGRQQLMHATIQPIVVSLAEAIEKSGEPQRTIDTNDIKELGRLLNIIEPGIGSNFLRSNAAQPPASVLEAHWQGIDVDLVTGDTSCDFCENYAESPLFEAVEGTETKENDRKMRVHCVEVYRPLKAFMLQNFKHVRYVHPPAGWNDEVYQLGRGSNIFDLIAGFTPGGVLCGVYVTDPRIPTRWIRSRLAPGKYEWQLEG